MKFNIAFIIFAFIVAACSSSKPKEDSPASTAHSDTAPRTSVEAKEIAADQSAAYVVEIAFPRGSSKLTPDAAENLRKFIEQSSKSGKIKEIKTVAWADAEYPSTATKKLSKKEVALADQRNKQLETYLNDKGISAPVTAYNMSERPGMFEEWLSTSDAKIKKSLESAGIPNTDTAVKVPSKARKAIVMSILE